MSVSHHLARQALISDRPTNATHGAEKQFLRQINQFLRSEMEDLSPPNTDMG